MNTADKLRDIAYGVPSQMQDIILQAANELDAAARGSLTKPQIEAEYHKQMRAAECEPRLATFDAFIAGVRFAEAASREGKA